MSTEKIRVLNDLYRTKGVGMGRTMMTASVVALGPGFQLAALLKVKTFTEFTRDNDPHSEHDFGASSSTVRKSFGSSTTTTAISNTAPRPRPILCKRVGF